MNCCICLTDRMAIRCVIRLLLSCCWQCHQLHIALIGFGRLVHHLEHALRARQRHNDHIELLRDLRYRLAEALVELQKRGEAAQRKAADAEDGKQRTGDGRERIADVADVVHHRAKDVGEAVGVVGAVEQLVVQRVKARDVLLLAAEHLHHLLTLHHLLDVAVHRAKAALLRHKVRAGKRRQLFGGKQHDAHHHHGQARQRQVEHEHRTEHAHHRHHGGNQLRHALADHLAQRIDIVGVNAHDVAVRVRIEIAQRQALHMPEQVIADVAHGPLRNIDHHAVLQKRAQHAAHKDAGHLRQHREQRPEIGRAALFVVGQDVLVDERFHEKVA